MNLVERYLQTLKYRTYYLRRMIRHVSYSSSRETTPMYTMGSPNPRMVTSGRTHIGGTVSFNIGLSYRQYEALIAMKELDITGLFSNGHNIIFLGFEVISDYDPTYTSYNFIASAIDVKRS